MSLEVFMVVLLVGAGIYWVNREKDEKQRDREEWDRIIEEREVREARAREKREREAIIRKQAEEIERLRAERGEVDD